MLSAPIRSRASCRTVLTRCSEISRTTNSSSQEGRSATKEILIIHLDATLKSSCSTSSTTAKASCQTTQAACRLMPAWTNQKKKGKTDPPCQSWEAATCWYSYRASTKNLGWTKRNNLQDRDLNFLGLKWCSNFILLTSSILKISHISSGLWTVTKYMLTRFWFNRTFQF